MHALVIYDSKFGNTREIALHIGRGLETSGEIDADVISTSGFDTMPSDLELLVIGAPTQAHGMEATMREFLDRLPQDRLANRPVAVFDTRMHWPRILSGSAADGIAKWLVGRGAVLDQREEGFFVDGKEGPLRDGEAERAEMWGRAIAARPLPA